MAADVGVVPVAETQRPPVLARPGIEAEGVLLDDDDNAPVLRIKQRDASVALQHVARNVVVGRIDVDAGFDAAYVRRSLRRESAQLERCYDNALVNDPSASGTVVVRFVIGIDGRVPAITASGFPEVERCIARAIRKMAFPKPTNGVTVEATLALTVETPVQMP